ncbi:MAG: DNA methyltransferase [Limisphaerales bacterium]|jgi:adenine-specific DNA-methyltransferase
MAITIKTEVGSKASFFETLLEVLKAEERFFAEDGTLLRNKVYESALSMDANLISLLLNNDETKKHFFVEVNGIFVFDKVGFGWVINNRQFLPDSYTRFKNRIGLTDSREGFISSSNDVVLSFPYKDCVLEGGQTKEDQKRDEVFYNATLAPDEVDRLLYPKVLVGAKRFTASGIEKDVTFNENDNLIIKGNNLLAISSLLKRYEGKVKCIFIDPPYNTHDDSFGYNNSFKRSSWLTFMSNRLLIAKRLLSKDGLIFIQVNYKEMSYLRVLCDELFDEWNYINTITIQTATTASYRSINDCPVNVSEFILVYSIDRAVKNINPVYRLSDYSEDYNYFIENFEMSYEDWSIVSVDSIIYRQEGLLTWQEFKNRYGDNWKHFRYEMKSVFCYENRNRVVSLNTMQKPSREILDCIETSKNNRDRVFAVGIERGKPTYVYNGRTLAFYRRKFRTIDGVESPSEVITNIWTDISFLSLGNEGGVDLPNGKKPEKLIKRILELATSEGDLVLDFFAGTGTTGAVAQKMRRRYILCEQMNYTENKTVKRLKKVIEGEQGGVSKAVDWQGGGSFVYCELAKCNQHFIDEVYSAKADTDLIDLLKRILDTGFISCKVNPAEIVKGAEGFAELAFDDKKRFILELLDKNMLYVNLCDLDDEEYAISEADKTFTRSFYKLENK